MTESGGAAAVGVRSVCRLLPRGSAGVRRRREDECDAGEYSGGPTGPAVYGVRNADRTDHESGNGHCTGHCCLLICATEASVDRWNRRRFRQAETFFYFAP